MQIIPSFSSSHFLLELGARKMKLLQPSNLDGIWIFFAYVTVERFSFWSAPTARYFALLPSVSQNLFYKTDFPDFEMIFDLPSYSIMVHKFFKRFMASTTPESSSAHAFPAFIPRLCFLHLTF